MNTSEPNVLNNKCIQLARFAFLLAPRDEINAVTHEPIFVPNIKNKILFVKCFVPSPAPI